MSARDELFLRLIETERLKPTGADELLDAFRAEVLAEAEAKAREIVHRLLGQARADIAQHRAVGARAVEWELSLMAHEAGRGESTPQDVTVYRAAYEHEPFPLGLYATYAAAQAHCEHEVSREHPAGIALFFEWCVDEDEPEVCELDVRIGDESTPTGYTVTAVVAEAAYDPEADS